MDIKKENLEYSSRMQTLGPFELFPVGWKLIFSEIVWFLKSRCQIWEVRQLNKRLKLENIALAELVQKRAIEDEQVIDLKDPEIKLSLGQIQLLREEVLYLQKEMQSRRDVFVEKRKQKYLKNQIYQQV